MSGFLLFMVSLLLASAVHADELKVCKWVDEQGVVHYSGQPPEGRKCEEMELLQPITPEITGEAQKKDEQLGESRSSSPELEKGEELGEIKKPRHAGRSGIPLPVNEISTYLTTISTGVSWNFQKRCGHFSLVLRVHENLPKRVLLEAHFSNPAAPGKEKVVKAVVRRGESRVLLKSPGFRGFKCSNYPVVIHIYDAGNRDQKLGTHYQNIQSTIDLSRIKSPEQMAGAAIYGNCGDK